MNKRVAAKTLVNLPGFRKRGSFYIGMCNESVMSGYALDAPPGTVYIWRFSLPSYDNIEFLHLSLGRRIVTVAEGNGNGVDSDKLSKLLLQDWSTLSKIQDCEALVRYMDSEKFDGTYALWVRFLTHIREKEYAMAQDIYNDSRARMKFTELRAISNHFEKLSEINKRGGWKECRLLLETWSIETMARFC